MIESKRRRLPAKLRQMAPEDISACLDLWSRCEGVVLRDWEDAQALEALLVRNPGGSWVIEHSGQLLGTILCGHDGWRGYVYHAAVDPEWRRAGLGSSLVDQALTYFCQQGIRRVHVLVSVENSPGHAFWQAMGAAQRYDADLFTLTLGTSTAVRIQ